MEFASVKMQEEEGRGNVPELLEVRKRFEEVYDITWMEKAIRPCRSKQRREKRCHRQKIGGKLHMGRRKRN